MQLELQLVDRVYFDLHQIFATWFEVDLVEWLRRCVSVYNFAYIFGVTLGWIPFSTT